MHCIDPESTLFNDMNEECTARWMQELRCQPANGWGMTTEHAGFRDAPSVYLMCEKDQAIPLAWQVSALKYEAVRESWILMGEHRAF